MPWIFLSLMLLNIVYLGVNFAQVGQSKPKNQVSTLDNASIILLSELPPPSALQPQTSTENSEVQNSLACYRVGPFLTDAPISSLAVIVKAQKATTKIINLSEQKVDYWVFIPSLVNTERAEQKIKEIKAKGIDGFIVREGGFLNAISLNHFKNSELALAYLRKMQAMGIQAEYREVSDRVAQKWLYIGLGTPKKSMRAEIDAFLMKQNSYRRETVPCEE